MANKKVKKPKMPWVHIWNDTREGIEDICEQAGVRFQVGPSTEHDAEYEPYGMYVDVMDLRKLRAHCRSLGMACEVEIIDDLLKTNGAQPKRRPKKWAKSREAIRSRGTHRNMAKFRYYDGTDQVVFELGSLDNLVEMLASHLQQHSLMKVVEGLVRRTAYWTSSDAKEMAQVIRIHLDNEFIQRVKPK